MAAQRAACLMLVAMAAFVAASSAAEEPPLVELSPKHLHILSTSFSDALLKSAGIQAAYVDAATAKPSQRGRPGARDGFRRPPPGDSGASLQYAEGGRGGEEYERPEESPYKPVEAESVCLTEKYRRDCVQIGGGGPSNTSVFTPAGRTEISEVGCCWGGDESVEPEPEWEGYYESEPGFLPSRARAAGKVSAAYASGGEAGDDEEPIILPYASKSQCTWDLTYTERSNVSVNEFTWRLGSASVTCYFSDSAETCGSPLTDGLIVTAKVDMFRVLALSRHPPTFGGLDASCNATYGSALPGARADSSLPPQVQDMLNRAFRRGKASGAAATADAAADEEADWEPVAEGVKAASTIKAGQQPPAAAAAKPSAQAAGGKAAVAAATAQPSPKAGAAQAGRKAAAGQKAAKGVKPAYYLGERRPKEIYYGTGIVLAGPITSITSLKHAIPYRQGVLQYVPFFWGEKLHPLLLDTTAIPPDTPLIRPNSYKLVFLKDGY